MSKGLIIDLCFFYVYDSKNYNGKHFLLRLFDFSVPISRLNGNKCYFFMRGTHKDLEWRGK